MHFFPLLKWLLCNETTTAGFFFYSKTNGFKQKVFKSQMCNLDHTTSILWVRTVDINVYTENSILKAIFDITSLWMHLSNFP